MFNQLTPISSSQMRFANPPAPVILTTILLVWVGLPVVAWPPGPLTAQTGDGPARRKAPMKSFRWNPASLSNESFPAVNRISTRPLCHQAKVLRDNR